MNERKQTAGQSPCSYFFWKRTCDLLLSSLLLVLLAIPLCVIALLVRLTSKGPVIFRQERIGKDGLPFRCYKFRTMYSFAPPDCPTAKLENAEKLITPIGRILRRASLDELPQLWNVFKGDMSLVGPRPLIPQEALAHQLRREKGIYRLRPGITGLAQINGRDLLSDEEKIALDLQYLHIVRLRTDVGILWKTVSHLFSGEGVYEGAKNKSS